MHAKSAVDRQFKTVVFGTIVLMCAAAVLLTLTVKFALYQVFIGDAAVLLASAFLLWLLYGTFYELRDTYLYCRSGPFVEKIFYDTIRYLGYSDNRLSSMALSFRRIEIRRIDTRPSGICPVGVHRMAICQKSIGLFTGTTMISPENREIFLAYLKTRCHYLNKAS